MKRLSEDEYQGDDEPGGGGDEPQSEGDPAVQVYNNDPDDPSEPSSSTEEARLLPEGMTSVEGEIPDGFFAAGEPDGEGEGGGQEDQDTDESSGEEETTTPTDEGEGEEGGEEGGADEDEEMDDVTASQGWLDDVTAQTGIEAEDEEEFVQTVNDLRRDVSGFSQFAEVLEQVPELAQVTHDLAGQEEIDPIDFYLAVKDIEGVDVSIPDAAEDPDAASDFQLRLKERRKKQKERREQMQEQEQKAKDIRRDFEQAFKSFKKRKNLDDKEAQKFKQRFRKVFYGDPEKGELPRMDVFDLAYEALEGGGEEDDTPIEETEAYKEGFNAAVEQMKSGGNTDGLPDLKKGGSGGSTDGGGQSGGANVPSMLAPTEGAEGMDHESF